MGGTSTGGASLFFRNFPETHRTDPQAIDDIAYYAISRNAFRKLPEFRNSGKAPEELAAYLVRWRRGGKVSLRKYCIFRITCQMKSQLHDSPFGANPRMQQNETRDRAMDCQLGNPTRTRHPRSVGPSDVVVSDQS